MARIQAPKGGQTGLNGEFYIGGQFLPSLETTEKGKIKSKRFQKNPQYKVEIDAYTWVINREEEGLRPIFNLIQGIDGDKAIIFATNGWSRTRIENLQIITDLWNSGERWILQSTLDEMWGNEK